MAKRGLTKITTVGAINRIISGTRAYVLLARGLVVESSSARSPVLGGIVIINRINSGIVRI